MTDTLEPARLQYAEALRSTTHMTSRALFDAFATVPRERFVGPGPWRILGQDGNWITEETDPGRIYQNSLISIDEAKCINNGQPSMWAHFLDQLGVRRNDDVLHLGCGTGYYTAILAELVGPHGTVTAIEIEEEIAERARIALAPWPQVEVVHRDGSSGSFELADAIVASAGATHPLPSWLDALKPGGRLLLPLAATEGPGAMVLLHRVTSTSFAARMSFGTYFIPFAGASDPEAGSRLKEALKRDRGARVKSLRRDPHAQEVTCWLHGDGWCFSTNLPAQLC